MAKGNCSWCGEKLTLENASPTRIRIGAGYCRPCAVKAKHTPRGKAHLRRQAPGIEWTFPCGHSGFLPNERGITNNFVIWVQVGKSKWIWICHEHENLRSKKKTQDLKLEVMSHYCRGIPYCQCPGCRNGKDSPVHIGALQMDHINGDGAKHKDANGWKLGGSALYYVIRKQHYPDTFQVLCANCNSPASKGTKKQCPFYGQPH